MANKSDDEKGIVFELIGGPHDGEKVTLIRKSERVPSKIFVLPKPSDNGLFWSVNLSSNYPCEYRMVRSKKGNFFRFFMHRDVLS